MAADPHLDMGHRYELPTAVGVQAELADSEESSNGQENAEEKQTGVIANRFLFCCSGAVFLF